MPKVFVALAVGLMLCFALVIQVQAAGRYENPKIVINIPSRTLSFYSGDQIIKKYSVGIGRMDHQTPVGEFKILYKEINPTWIKPLKEGESPLVIPSGPDNPLGYRWMEFADLYGVHGTNDPDSVGGYVSNGCVRMHESDVEELYDMVPLATPLIITYNRLNVRLDANQSVTLFIYPDEYQRAPLNIDDINRNLAQYDVAGFISNDRLYKELREADGKPIAIGRPFAMTVIGKNIEGRGILQDGVSYLPVIPIATELKLALHWDASADLLTSPYGTVPGYVRNDVLYVKSEDAFTLYHLYTKWYPNSDRMHLNTYNEEV